MYKSKFPRIALSVIFIIAISLTCLSGCGSKWEEYDENENYTEGETDNGNENSTETNFSEFTTEYTATDYVSIDVKDYGIIKVALDANKAPITVKNFKKLIKEGFYDGLTFHRIMKDFMMQGGDPEGTGSGGSDKEIKGEFQNNGVDNPLSHIRGAISMARNDMSMDSASSQFFICHKDSTFLDGRYACFGYVIDGIDVVDKVCGDANPTDDNGTIPADQQPVINKITIIDKP